MEWVQFGVAVLSMYPLLLAKFFFYFTAGHCSNFMLPENNIKPARNGLIVNSYDYVSRQIISERTYEHHFALMFHEI